MECSDEDFKEQNVEDWLRTVIKVKDSAGQEFADFTVTDMQKNIKKGIMQVKISVNKATVNLLIPIRKIKGGM